MVHFYDKVDRPHAMYRLHGKTGELLYVGCSLRPFSRSEDHTGTQSWRREIVQITLTWFDDYLSAYTAENRAIAAEHPKYNKRSVPDDKMFRKTLGQSFRGDGVHCPRCQAPKENRRQTCCNACMPAYRKERKIAGGWIPRPGPTILCPRCGGDKPTGPAYCKKCKRAVSREYREKLRKIQVGS